MADQIATLGFSIDSSQATKAATALDAMTAAAGKAEKQAAAVGSSSGKAAAGIEKVGASAKNAERSTSAFASSIKAIGIGFLAKEVLRTADAYTNLNARLQLVTTSTAQFNRVNTELFSIAQGTRQTMGDTVDLYTRLSRATASLGTSEKDRLKVTDAVNKAIIISGASAQQASSALIQLGQGFASGTLRGEELNSVLENTPRIAQAIADGLGISVGQLRKYGEEGKLTSERVIGALLSQSGQLNSEFEKMPITVSQAMTKIGNSIGVVINRLDNATNSTSSLAKALSSLADVISNPNLTAPLGAGIELKGAQLAVDQWLKRLDSLVAQKEKGEQNFLPKYLGIGTTLDAEIRAVEKGLAEAVKKRDAVMGKLNAGRPVEVNPRDALSDVNAEDRKRETAQLNAASLAWSNLTEKHKSAEMKLADLRKEFLATGKAAGASEAEIAMWLKAIEPKGNAKSQLAERAAIERELFEENVSRAKDSMREYTTLYRDRERILDAQRQAGLVGDREYFEEKRRLAGLSSEVEIQALEKEAAFMRSRDLKASDAIENRKRLASVEQKIAEARAEAATQSTLLNIQERSSAEAMSKAYLAAKQSADEFLASVRRRQQDQLDAAGKGDRERERLAGRTDLERQYGDQLLALQRERVAAQTEEQRNAIDKQLAISRDYQKTALSEYDTFWTELRESEGEWRVGALEALANYADGARNVAQQTANAVSSTLGKAEKAMEDFFRTGKIDVRNFVNDILIEMAKIQFRKYLGQAVGAISGYLGGGSTSQPEGGDYGQYFAKGGVVNSPTPFRFANGGTMSSGLMGEAGPEAIMPLRRDKNGRLGVSGATSSPVFQTTVNINGQQSTGFSSRELARTIEAANRNSYAEMRKRNGD